MPASNTTAPHACVARRLAARTASAGLLLYALCAPHSIAGAWVALSLVVLGWLARTLLTRRLGLRRTPLDLPLWALFGWSVLSAICSAEPRISLLKLISVSTFLIYYCVQAVITRRTAVLLATVLIVSGCAGVGWSVVEIVRGRGVVVEWLAPDNPLRGTGLREGDAVWRVNGLRVNSATELAEAVRRAEPGTPLRLSVITRGEHVEWNGPPVTEAMKTATPPAGIYGTQRTHRFRASGWTRHYETFAELLQLLAQLALGFALAHLQRRAPDPKHARLRGALYAAAFILLAAGIALTAMRTVLLAFAAGACVLLLRWRAGAAGRRARHAVLIAVALICVLGAFAVWRTRATGALRLQDESARLRVEVARQALARVPLHPVFGHGMDAVHEHWHDWGFPGTNMLHAHSTPIQLAFDRGLPALFIWLWLILTFWLITTRAERRWRAADDDAGPHGLLLGATGALAGFFVSSLVNYNFGDAEVTLLLWWLMAAVVRTDDEGQMMNDE
ncbi:MAG TPA: O-antigen ligase family protein [Pyrinomonadaceae bacterium]